MSVRWGEEYRGSGCTDLTKTRGEREEELLALARTADGRDVIAYYYGRYTETPEGVCPPVGLLMVQTVLRYEYPSR